MRPVRTLAMILLPTTMAAAPVTAQPMPGSPPNIGYVYPAGGRQGSTFRVTVGGQFLDGVRAAYISGDGVHATVVEHTKPLTPQQFNTLREKLRELQEKKAAAKGQPLRDLLAPRDKANNTTEKREGGREPTKGRAPVGSRPTTRPVWTAEDERMLAEIRTKLANLPKRQGNPAIAETVTLDITVARDAEPNKRELRLATPLMLTNPLVFCVGELPEFSEEPARSNAAPGAGQRKKPEQPRFAPGPDAGEPAPATTVTLPAVVNGQIMPGTVDRYRFKARKGERVVIAALARTLVPYLADAVPGWFQATLALYDADGRELAYNDDYRFHPDPMLCCQIPRDGEYVMEIKDAIYRGREDFVYRITAGKLPFLASVFPLGARAGTQTTVQPRGWNLPLMRLTPATDTPGIHPLTIHAGKWTSNPVPFAVDTLPEQLEQEPNNEPARAQPVATPVIVNGRIEPRGDRDVYRVEGKPGDAIVAEVHARRLGSPLDATLTLTDAAGREIAYNDDHEDKADGLNTHHADPWLRATLPHDGICYVHLAEAQDKGGPEYAYRLRIGPPRPDFELRIVPSGITVRPGGTVPLVVHALRKDGFTGEITLSWRNAPAGFTWSGARVAPNQDHARFTLTAPPTPCDDPIRLSFEGRAVMGEQTIVRPVVPADDRMQAFAYQHLVPASEMLLIVAGRPGPRMPPRILSPTPIRISPGGTAAARISIPAFVARGGLHFELSEPPEGIAIRSVSHNRDSAEILLQCDAARTRPGLQGNLIVNLFAEKPAAPGKGKADGNRRHLPIGTLPAIPFEIVAATSLPSKTAAGTPGHQSGAGARVPDRTREPP